MVFYTSIYFRDRSHPKQLRQKQNKQKNPKKTTKEHKENFGGDGYCDCGDNISGVNIKLYILNVCNIYINYTSIKLFKKENKVRNCPTMVTNIILFLFLSILVFGF